MHYFTGIVKTFIADVKRYVPARRRRGTASVVSLLRAFFWNPALWAIALFRFRHWLQCTCRFVPLRLLLKVPIALIGLVIEVLIGIHIDPEADIGEGLYIGHYGSIWMGPVKIGANCNISQEVTIGVGGKGEFRGIPVIGNRVYIGPGAKVFGRISIGDNVAIGANAVVSKSLPSNAVALGNPARIVNYEGSDGFIEVTGATYRRGEATAPASESA